MSGQNRQVSNEFRAMFMMQRSPLIKIFISSSMKLIYLLLNLILDGMGIISLTNRYSLLEGSAMKENVCKHVQAGKMD